MGWPIEQIVIPPGEAGIEAIKTGVDWEQYCAIPAMNPSTLCSGLKSMRHLKYNCEHSREDTDDLLWGRAVHCLLFEPKEFENRYIAFRGARRAGNVWEETLERATALSLEILNGKQWDTAQEAALSFINEPDVQELIQAGQAEVTLMATEFGLQCRGRVDWIASGKALVDLKTTKNIEASKFGRDFFAYKYDFKLGLYRRWLERLTGRQWPVKVIALEKQPPWDVAVIPIDNAILDQGVNKALRVLADLKQAIATNHWPGVANGQQYDLDVPAWEMMDEELSGAEEWAA